MSKSNGKEGYVRKMPEVKIPMWAALGGKEVGSPTSNYGDDVRFIFIPRVESP